MRELFILFALHVFYVFFFWGGVTKLEYIHISNSLLLLCHLIPNLLFFYRFEIMHSVYDCTSNNFKIIQRKKMQ